MWTITKEELIRNNLSIEEYFILMLLVENEMDVLKELYPIFPHSMSTLQIDNYIRAEKHNDWNSVIITTKTTDIFSTKYKNIINFDEFWDNFPIKTPSGRCLRPQNKMWGGETTKDYIDAKKKYLAVVKSIENHQTIVSILVEKAKKATKEDREYENNIITYINQRKWQKDARFLEGSAKLNRM